MRSKRQSYKFSQSGNLYNPRQKDRSVKPRKHISFEKIFRKVDKYVNALVAIVIIVSLVTGVFYVFKHTDFMKISNVKVLGAKTFVSSSDVMEFVKGMTYERNILVVDSKKIEDSLLKNFQGAKRVVVHKRFPNTINVQIVEREPLALLDVPAQESYFLVDEDGYVLGTIDKNNASFPVIRYEGEAQVGYFVDKNLVPVYLELINLFDEENLKASSLSVRDRDIRFFLDNSIEVYLNKKFSLKESVNVLAQTFKQLSMENKKIKRIDLRYDKVVVSYYD